MAAAEAKTNKSVKVSLRSVSLLEDKSAFSDLTGKEEPLGNIEGIFLTRDDSDKSRYGWGTFTPNALQFLRSPAIVLSVLCFIAFINGSGIHGAFEGSGRQLERLFGIQGDIMKWMLVAYYVGVIVAILPIGYFGSHSAHKPRWITIGCILVSVGCFVCIIPHLMTDNKYRRNMLGATCAAAQTENYTRHCEEDKEKKEMSERKNNVPEIVVFLLGLFIYGMGNAAPQTMGLVLIDEHVSYRYSSIFTGTFRTLDTLGPFTGHLLTSVIAKGRDTTTKSSEQEFSGTWWIPMLACAVLSLICAIIMSGYPRELAGETQARLREMMEDAVEGWRSPDLAEKEWTKDVGDSGIDLIKRALVLISQPIYVGLIAEQIFTAFMITGFSSVFNEYIEKHFNVPSQLAGLQMALIMFIGLLGISASMYLQFQFEFQLKQNLIMIVVSALGAAVCINAFFIKCEISFVGINYQGDLPGGTMMTTPAPSVFPRKAELSLLQYDAKCASECKALCSLAYQPSCGEGPGNQWLKFYSPCFAGCQEATASDGHNCSCVYQKDGTGGGGTVTTDYCKEQCLPRMIAFLIAMSWCSFFVYLRKNAVDQATLRYVPFKFRLVAFCFVAAIARFIGSLPSVFLFRKVLDNSCIRYGGLCGEICAMYDPKSMTLYVALGFLMASLIVVVITVSTYLFFAVCGPQAYQDSTTSVSKKSKEMKSDGGGKLKLKSKAV